MADDTTHAAHDTDASAGGHYGYFHFSYHTVLLFEQWTTHSWPALIGSCVVALLFAMLYELVKFGRKQLRNKSKDQTHEGCSAFCNHMHLIQTLLEVLQVFLGYVVMLLVMSFNVAICISIMLGVGLGYYLFGWYTAENEYDNIGHC